MKNFAKIIILLLMVIFSMGTTYRDSAFVINATKNASTHNNLGINYMNERDYFSAIKEFEIAIQLNPNTQASGTYYNNLGKVYLKIGHAKLAEKCFVEAYKRNNVNFEYYQNMVKSYKAQGKLKSELRRYQNDKKANSAVFIGLILIEQGNLEAGINRLDEFCFDEPEMILTKGIKEYIQEIAPKDLRFDEY